MMKFSQIRSCLPESVTAASLLLVAAVGSPAADWPQLQCDAARSRFQPAMALNTSRHTNSNPPGYRTPAWAWDAPEPLSGQPVTAAGIVAIGTLQGGV